MATTKSWIKKKADVLVGGGRGGMYTFYLESRKAKSWVKKNVDVPKYAWLTTNAFAMDDGRLAYELYRGMLGAGLKCVDA